MRWMLALMVMLGAARADSPRSGDFDYYLLALSWTPTWCALEGDARGSAQCDPGRGFGFTLHGLWPQHERGWPSYCRTPHREASRAETAAMADIMGSSGLAWHQWKKHGRCSGLSPSEYFAAARAAYEAIVRPPRLRALDREVTLPALLIEEAFLAVNSGLSADQLTVTCKADRIQEVRICLTKDLEPRRCGADVIRDCRHTGARFSPMR